MAHQCTGWRDLALGQTPLFHSRSDARMVKLTAAQNGHTETVRALHELKADVRVAANTLTAVMLAAQVVHPATHYTTNCLWVALHVPSDDLLQQTRLSA